MGREVSSLRIRLLQEQGAERLGFRPGKVCENGLRAHELERTLRWRGQIDPVVVDRKNRIEPDEAGIGVQRSIPLESRADELAVVRRIEICIHSNDPSSLSDQGSLEIDQEVRRSAAAGDVPRPAAEKTDLHPLLQPPFLIIPDLRMDATTRLAEKLAAPETVPIDRITAA
jgi:hypothetical protein